MTETQSLSSDKGIGLTVMFTLLAVGGAALMFVSPDSDLSGWGFAFAMLAGTLAVAAVHLYWN